MVVAEVSDPVAGFKQAFPDFQLQRPDRIYIPAQIKKNPSAQISSLVNACPECAYLASWTCLK